MALRDFKFHGEVQERSLTLLLILTPTRFSEASHVGTIRIFLELVKRPTIPAIESKQYSLSNMRVIIDALCVLEDNRLKKNHPLSVPLPRTNPVKFYRQNSHKSLPNFPGRCVVALVRNTNEFFPTCLPLIVFKDSYIQVVSLILVHPILVDTI